MYPTSMQLASGRLHATLYLQLLEGFPVRLVSSHCGTLGIEGFLPWVGRQGALSGLASCESFPSGLYPFWPAEGSIETQNFVKPRTHLGSASLYVRALAEF